MIEDLLSVKATLEFTERLKGDPRDTWADISKAQTILKYNPVSSLKTGLEQQINDIRLALNI